MTGISVEVMPDAGPPQVGITVDGLGAGTSTVTVEVSWDGQQTWHGVRGWARRTVVGGAAFGRDHVPPLNTPATYRLTVHTGTTPDTVQATIVATSSTAWLQDPLAPRTAVAIRTDTPASTDQVLMYGALAAATWQQAVDLVTPSGATLPVASIGQRILAGDVPLTISHDVAAEGGALRRLLLGSGQLVVRGLPTHTLLEPVAHIAVGPATETRIGARGQVSWWALSATQVRPQSLRLVVPWWTYEQVAALWAGATYADATAARPGETYLDWQRSPEAP